MSCPCCEVIRELEAEVARLNEKRREWEIAVSAYMEGERKYLTEIQRLQQRVEGAMELIFEVKQRLHVIPHQENICKALGGWLQNIKSTNEL